MPPDEPTRADVRAVRELGPGQDGTAFTAFVREHQTRLRQALIATLGGEVGREATAEALAWAWEHWPRLQTMDNPVGYLYRLGKNRGISMLRRRRPAFPSPSAPSSDGPWVEPGLPAAVARLSETQRVAVLLVHAFGWTYREVAEHMSVAVGTVQVHVERALTRLRHDLKVETHA
jgi:DNA-directed RNA polymerase specialized sigma24 family protein